VRSYIENSLDKIEALSKLFYMGPMFRGERPQKGRLRQFHQIGAEAIGPNSASPFLDAELIALAVHLLKDLGVKGPRLKINSLGSKEDKANISIWLRGEFTKHKNDLCEDCQSRYERNVFRVLDCKKEGCRKLVASVVTDLPLSPESQKYFGEVQSALKSIGIAFEVSPYLVRGLDYYTHTVFEITAEGLGSQDAVGAGGRYGGLVHELGGSENVEGIGFALGLERILLASGKTIAMPSGTDVFVIAMKEEYKPQGFALLQQIRQAGFRADMNFAGGSMKSQMGRANKALAHFTLILGEDEIKNQTAALKDMQKSVQETIAWDKIVDHLRKVL
jgi:histidyl-tRNA synthetase